MNSHGAYRIDTHSKGVGDQFFTPPLVFKLDGYALC